MVTYSLTTAVLLYSMDLSMLVVVASQCLESAYGITVRDVDAVSLYPLPASLQQIFAAGLSQMVGVSMLRIF